eukprot:GFYU01010272.1.p1 GENE.GFYU01010272.1~~GFYU01010272.1.p1  ORF type:complete len:234 (+),score=77.84 GFYU01010272.1:2-703(+)
MCKIIWPGRGDLRLNKIGENRRELPDGTVIPKIPDKLLQYRLKMQCRAQERKENREREDKPSSDCEPASASPVSNATTLGSGSSKRSASKEQVTMPAGNSVLAPASSGSGRGKKQKTSAAPVLMSPPMTPVTSGIPGLTASQTQAMTSPMQVVPSDTALLLPELSGTSLFDGDDLQCVGDASLVLPSTLPLTIPMCNPLVAPAAPATTTPTAPTKKRRSPGSKAAATAAARSS